MKKSILLLCMLAWHLATQAQISPVYTYKFQHALDSVCKKNKIKGISVAIYRPGEGIWTGAYGESHENVPITTDMYLPIGSNTKTFVAAAMLKLQENGQLHLDDTIGTWITHPNVDGKITIRQMLNHTSGLNDYTKNNGFFQALNADYNKVWQPEEMYPFIDTMVSAPGTDWEYCNTNYLLAGIIISKVTGKTVEQGLRDLILTPQNLSDTYFYPHEPTPTAIPHGWVQMSMNTPMEDIQVNYNYTNIAFLSMASAAGAYVSTAEDNVKFWHQLMTGQIINQASLAEMKELVYLNASNSYGLGLFKFSKLNGRNIYAHGGTCFGYLNENAYDSVSGTCITVLSNQDSINNNLLFNRVVNTLHRITLEMPPLGISEYTATEPLVYMYPNPAAEQLYIKSENLPQSATLTMYDMTGKVVQATSLTTGSQTLPVAHLPQGLYLVRIADNGRMLYQQRVEIIK